MSAETKSRHTALIEPAANSGKIAAAHGADIRPLEPDDVDGLALLVKELLAFYKLPHVISALIWLM